MNREPFVAPHDRIRTLCRLIETYHALVYFAPERPAVYSRYGFRGGWSAYFATRAAALGAVPPGVVTACFFGFAHSMVSRALPAAWSRVTPDDALSARYEVFDLASRRILGERACADTTAELAELLGEAAARVEPHGSPMFAAHVAARRPTGPHLALFWAATALREFRGDAHITALRAAGVSPVESHVLMAALRLVPQQQREFRGYSEQQWADAVASLIERGWLEANGAISEEGRRQRSMVEHVTDVLAASAFDGTGDGPAQLTSALAPLVEQFVTAGAVPYPNAIGVAPAPEVAVPR